MDDLSEVLNAVRFRGDLHCRVDARAPWGLFGDRDGAATFHGLVRGCGVLRLEPDNNPIAVAQGDLVIICHGAHHAIADTATTPLQPIRDLLAAANGSRVVHTGGRGAHAEIICGRFAVTSRDAPPVLGLLPPLLHIKGSPAIRSILELLAGEVDNAPGAAAVIARLTDALFLHAIRAWRDTDAAANASWLAALRDPAIARALAAVHREPARDWTVHSLARAVAMSRSAFAERFGTIVGETPLAYVTRLRLYLAARELRETTRSVAEIATLVGYDSEASLGKAFKRALGVPPGAYRRGERTS
jgi:AraC-like DNA-binding protein